LSEEEIKQLAEYRLFLEETIKDLEAKLELYRGLLKVVDEQLKKVSFVIATKVKPAESYEEAEVRPLRRQKDGYLLANAYIKKDSITIVPAPDVTLYVSTIPFKSFFIGKVLNGMRMKDENEVKAGKLRKDQVMSYKVDEKDGKIEKIQVFNYKDKQRLNEIINTAIWTFTRMLEKQV
jgi:hypothetical protein